MTEGEWKDAWDNAVARAAEDALAEELKIPLPNLSPQLQSMLDAIRAAPTTSLVPVRQEVTDWSKHMDIAARSQSFEPTGAAGNTFTLHGDNGCARAVIKFGRAQPTVWVDPEIPWDQAAKIFWNAVARIVGQPRLFTDAD